MKSGLAQHGPQARGAELVADRRSRCRDDRLWSEHRRTHVSARVDSDAVVDVVDRERELRGIDDNRLTAPKVALGPGILGALDDGDAEAPSSPGLAVLALAAVRGVQALGRSAGALIRRIFLQAQELFDEMYASLGDRSSRALLNRLSRVDVRVIDERTGSAVIPTIQGLNTHEPNASVAPIVAIQMLHHVGHPSRAPVGHSCRAPERQGRPRVIA